MSLGWQMLPMGQCEPGTASQITSKYSWCVALNSWTNLLWKCAGISLHWLKKVVTATQSVTRWIQAHCTGERSSWGSWEIAVLLSWAGRAARGSTGNLESIKLEITLKSMGTNHRQYRKASWHIAGWEAFCLSSGKAKTPQGQLGQWAMGASPKIVQLCNGKDTGSQNNH